VCGPGFYVAPDQTAEVTMTDPGDQELMRSDAYAKLLGVELVSVEEGHAVARMELAEHHLNFMGGVHGGAIFSLADVAFAAASNSEGHKAVAIHLAIDFLSAPGDTPYLEADVRKVARAGRTVHYDMRVTNSEGDLVGVCSGWSYHTDRPIA